MKMKRRWQVRVSSIAAVNWVRKNYYLLWPLLLAAGLLTQLSGSFRNIFLENSLVIFLTNSFSQLLGLSTSLLPFSLTELLLAGLVTGFVSLAAKKLIQTVRASKLETNKNFIKNSHIIFHKIALIVTVFYVTFIVLYGSSYYQEPIAEKLNLNSNSYSAAELVETTEWLVLAANNIREDREEDSNGVFKLSTDLNEIFSSYSEGYRALEQKYPEIGGEIMYPKAKPVVTSPVWSHTGSAGLYFPFFAEVNINTSIPESQLPHVVLHEAAHFKGYAKENEANFLAFLGGIYHSDADFKYSAVIAALSYCLAATKNIDETSYQELVSTINSSVMRDIYYKQNFWNRHKGFFRKVTNSINDQYLKANRQQDGVQSYGKVTDLIVAWYRSGGKEIKL